MATQTMITISAERYRELLIAEAKLGALENGGVDNWEWFYESLEEHGYFTYKEEIKNMDFTEGEVVK
jgi:hypothetical protein